MLELPDTSALPIIIKTASFGPYASKRSVFIHPQTGKPWAPAIVGNLFCVNGGAINPVGGVYRAKFGGGFIYFYNPAPGRSGKAAPVDSRNLPGGCFFVPLGEGGSNACAWLPESGKDSVTTIPAKYYSHLFTA